MTFSLITTSILCDYGAPLPKAGLSGHNFVTSYYAIVNDYTAILDANSPTKSPIAERASKSVQVAPSP